MHSVAAERLILCHWSRVRRYTRQVHDVAAEIAVSNPSSLYQSTDFDVISAHFYASEGIELRFDLTLQRASSGASLHFSK